MVLGQRKRSYLQQFPTEASIHVLTADWKKKNKKEKREKAKHHGNAEHFYTV